MSRTVHAEVDLVRDTRYEGRDLIGWIESGLEKVIDPLIRVVGRPISKVRPEGALEDRPWGEPGELFLDIATTLRPERLRVRSWSKKALDDLKGDLMKGSVVKFDLSGQLLDGQGFPDLERHFAIHFEEYETMNRRVCILRTTASRDLYGNHFNQDFQRGWVELFKDSACLFNATYGYLTLDFTGIMTPYEESVGRPDYVGLEECTDWSRGYFWGNVLNGTHVEKLGGWDRVAQTFPGHLTEIISNTNKPLLYLQLSSDLDDFSDDSLRALRDFLQPILPSGPGLLWKARPWRLVSD